MREASRLSRLAYSHWVPYVAADAGSLSGGWLSGYLIARGWSVDRSRKLVILIAALLMPAGILAAFAHDAMVALALIGVVLFGFQVWINNVQTLPSDFFSDKAVASVAGLGGTGAGIGSMIFIFGTGLGGGPLFIRTGVSDGGITRPHRDSGFICTFRSHRARIATAVTKTNSWLKVFILGD